jgi:acetyl-CoA C-acetyltransferase
VAEAFVLETLRTARTNGVVVDRDEHLRPGTSLETLAALEPAFVQQGAGGQDGLTLAIHPEVGEIRHLHTVGTSPALPDAAALVLIGGSAATWTPGRNG